MCVFLLFVSIMHEWFFALVTGNLNCGNVFLFQFLRPIARWEHRQGQHVKSPKILLRRQSSFSPQEHIHRQLYRACSSS